jgi:hypothetical protein
MVPTLSAFPTAWPALLAMPVVVCPMLLTLLTVFPVVSTNSPALLITVLPFVFVPLPLLEPLPAWQASVTATQDTMIACFKICIKISFLK